MPTDERELAYLARRLDFQDGKQLVQYYQSYYPQLIVSHKRLDSTWALLTMDTQLLYDDVAPQLGDEQDTVLQYNYT